MTVGAQETLARLYGHAFLFPKASERKPLPAVTNVSLSVHSRKTAEERAASHAARKRREQVALRCTEEEAQRIRNAAAGAGKSLRSYVLAAVEGQSRPIVDLSDVARISTAVAALLAAPHAVRDLEAELGRLSGRLSHLFTIDYALASEHREEIHATLNQVHALLRDMPYAVAALQATTAEPRAEIVRVLRCVAAALDV